MVGMGLEVRNTIAEDRDLWRMYLCEGMIED
jgi:hypothetical protein